MALLVYPSAVRILRTPFSTWVIVSLRLQDSVDRLEHF
jgi:hypothetical protein